MKLSTLTLTTLLCLGMAGTAQAQERGKTYVNAGVLTVETFDALALQGRVGHSLNQYFGVEADGAVGVIGQKDTFGSTEVTTNLDYSVAGYGVARVQSGSQMALFVRGGYHATGISEEALAQSFSLDFDGFAVGGGVRWYFDERNGIRLEYTYLDAGDLGDGIDTFGLSYARRF